MRYLSPFIPCFSALSLLGCLYTSHNYQTGRILKEGHSGTTIGYGRQQLVSLECHSNSSSWGQLVREDGDTRCRSINDPSGTPDTSYSEPVVNKESIPEFSYGYGLGIRDRWGPFPGLEMGFLLELPTMPISAEFYFRLGLPDHMWQRTKHSASLGYIIGSWSDNSYYLGYGISREVGRHLAYANFRSTIMATQVADIEPEEVDDAFKFNHNRRFVQQLSLGFMWMIPGIVVFPDFVTPQINFIYPKIPVSFDMESFGYDHDGVYIKWNVGFGWRF
ncbi:hypothetical protein ACFL5V_06275 [Fibrobacterota bacterium]